MNNPIKGATPLLKITIVGAFLVGLVLSGFGVLLVYIGATGNTSLDFFGQTLKTTNIGIAAIFIGAALITLLVRRSLKSLDVIAGRSLAINRKGINNDAYEKLWRITGFLPKWPRSNEVTYEQLIEFSNELKEFYFNEGGIDLSLSEIVKMRYEALQESLIELIEDNKSGKISLEDYESIRGKCSKLRTAITQDIKSR